MGVEMLLAELGQHHLLERAGAGIRLEPSMRERIDQSATT